MPRRCFFSFHYKPDNWRASKVRNIGVIDGNRAAHDNDWESIKKGGDSAIKRWIAEQMRGRSCTIVLIGTNTANRKWINHEIVKSWDDGMGVVGIYIHGLTNRDNMTSAKGTNPFDFITHTPTGKKLSSIVRCYEPKGSTSRDKYNWIAQYITSAADEAVRIRKGN